MYTEILKIIEGGLDKDRNKVVSYSKILSENLIKDGEEKFAKKINTVLEKNSASTTYLDSFLNSPVDQDTRLKIADVIFPSEDINLILNNDVKERIEEFILSIDKREDLHKLGINNATSLLLYGYPGTGKTSIAKLISYKTNLPLVMVRFDSLISSLLGSTSKNIRRIFDYANSRPCILFLDEFDAIAKARDDKQELGELKRVINSLLQNIDNFNENNVLIAATNHHELLDSAIWRRFSISIEVLKPSLEQIPLLVKEYLNKMDYDFKDNPKKFTFISNALYGMSAADIKNVCSNAIRKSVLENKNRIEFPEFLYEIYLYKNHSLKDIEKAIIFLKKHGVSKRSIFKMLNVPIRKVDSVLIESEEIKE